MFIPKATKTYMFKALRNNVMVSVFASGVVDTRFDRGRVKPKTIKSVFLQLR